MAKSNEQRKDDLGTLLAKLKRRRTEPEPMSLDDLSNLYGLTKPAFVNLRKTIPAFPDPCKREGNQYFYPALAAVQALYDYVVRHERQHLERGKRFSMLVTPPRQGEDEDVPVLSAGEQLKAMELRERLREEAVRQGQLHESRACAETTEKVLTLISRTFGTPTAIMDPNGQWPADVRAAVDQAGEGLVLRCYELLRDMLGGNADPGSSRPPPTGREGQRSGQARASGRRKRSVES